MKKTCGLVVGPVLEQRRLQGGQLQEGGRVISLVGVSRLSLSFCTGFPGLCAADLDFSVCRQAVQRFTRSPSVQQRGALKRNFCKSFQFLHSVPKPNDICSGIFSLQYSRHCPVTSATASSSGPTLAASVFSCVPSPSR